MILYPRSDQNSDDDRLALLADPDLAKRLRKANPKFFTRVGHHSIAKALALAGIVSLVAGYFLEPVVNPPYRNHDHEAAVTTLVQHVAPVPAHVRVHYSAASPVHVRPVIASVPKPVTAEPEPQPQLQPQKKVHRRAHTLTVTQVQPQPQAQNEERFWLQAQAEARAKDRMRAKAQEVTAAAESAAEDNAVQAPPKAPPDTGGATAKIIVSQPPVNGPRIPPPVSEPWPTLPGGGSCTPGRGPILAGGHGLAGVLINAVLQSAIPVHHRP